MPDFRFRRRCLGRERDGDVNRDVSAFKRVEGNLMPEASSARSGAEWRDQTLPRVALAAAAPPRRFTHGYIPLPFQGRIAAGGMGVLAHPAKTPSPQLA